MKRTKVIIVLLSFIALLTSISIEPRNETITADLVWPSSVEGKLTADLVWPTGSLDKGNT